MVLVQIDLNVEMGTPAATGVPFTITAVNNGNQTVTDIRITDELGNPVHEGSFSLDPGQSRSYSYLVVPVSTEPVRNVAFQLTGTDALGEAYEPEYEQTYEVHPFVDDSQLSVTLLPEILEPWTAQTGAVRVRVIIRNTSAVELINAVLSESTLGDLATYDVLNNGDTIFEQELVIGSPRNLTFSIKAVDPAGTERVLTGAMLTVAYPTATDTPAPTMPAAELPTEGSAGGWNSTLVIVLIIVGAVMLAAFTALIILAVLEHRRTGGIALDDELEDLDEPDESIDLAFDEDPVPPGPAPARTSSGQRTAEEFVRIAEERRQRPCEHDADDGEHRCNDGRAAQRMHERLIRTGDVPAAKAYGRNRDAADRGQHEGRAYQHDERHGEVHRAQRVRPDAVADEHAVNYREQEKRALAQYGRYNVICNFSRSLILHLFSVSPNSSALAFFRFSRCRRKRLRYSSRSSSVKPSIAARSISSTMLIVLPHSSRPASVRTMLFRFLVPGIGSSRTSSFFTSPLTAEFIVCAGKNHSSHRSFCVTGLSARLSVYSTQNAVLFMPKCAA